MTGPRVFFDVAASLDGFIAPEGMDLAHNAGLVDEFTLHCAPLFFGEGTSLFAGIRPDINVRIKEAVPSKDVTHISYEVVK